MEVINFGCRLNLAEGEAMRSRWAESDDLVIVNSCAVTAEAERQARQAIRRAARARPDARIILAGCAAETGGTAIAAMPEVAAIWRKPAVLPRAPSVSGANHARAFIEVQNGCDHDCTFCITTIARGASRSFPVDAVVQAVKAAVERGQQEVILTGVDLTSWGQDLPATLNLGHLVRAVLDRVPALPRLRLSSLDSIEIDPQLEEMIVGEQRLMPHVHLSLQHGDDIILKRMKRRHSRTDAIALTRRLKSRRPNLCISADLIAGFPTEDELAFANTLSLIDDCDLQFAHVFAYSPRPGTAAARMPQLGRAIVKERASRLRSRAADRKRRWLHGLVGTSQTALIERDGMTGHLDNFAAVRLEGPLPNGNMQGTMTDLIITDSDGDTLIGRPL